MTPYESTLLGQIDRRYLGSVHVKRAFAILLAVVMGVLVYQAQRKADKAKVGYREVIHGAAPAADEDDDKITRKAGAFGRWMYDIRQSESQGKDIYRDYWFPTPPIVLAILKPFAYLPDRVGAALWAGLKLAAAAAAVGLVLAAIARPDRPMPFGIALVAVAFGLRPLIGDVQHGNVNILVLLPIALTLYAWVRGRNVLAGAALGLAVAMKLTPALLGVYYLYRRQWGVVLGLVIGLAAFGFVLPAAAFGPMQTVDYWRGWYGVMVRPFVEEGWITFEARNQSMPGTLLRWFAGSGLATIGRIDQAGALEYGSLALVRAQEAWVRAALRIASLMVVGALAWLCRTRFAGRRDPRVGLEFALVLLAMLMLSERTWKHHCVTFVAVYAAVWYALACFAWSVRYRMIFAIGLGVQFVLLSLTGEELLGDAVGRALMMGGVVFVGILLGFVQTAWLLRSRWEPLVQAG